MAEGNRHEIVAKITQIVERIGDPEGIEVVDVQVLGGVKARLVRVYIDKAEGVSHTDCEFISRRAGEIFDAEDVVPGGTYTLEVSSPGVERKLSKTKDFERFTGQKAKITLREPLENQRHWEGTLAAFENGVISLEAQNGKRVQFPFAQVEKANLKFEW